MFTPQEFDVLIEAMESWENKDAAAELIGSMVDGLARRGASPHDREEIDRARRHEKLSRERDRQIRKDRSTLIKAKLITLRDRSRAEQLMESVSGGGACTNDT